MMDEISRVSMSVDEKKMLDNIEYLL